MQKAISHNILKNKRKILNKEKEAKLRRNNIIYVEVPKWMQLPQPNHLNYFENNYTWKTAKTSAVQSLI